MAEKKDVPNEFVDRLKGSNVSSPVFAGVPTHFNTGEGDSGLDWRPPNPMDEPVPPQPKRKGKK